MATTTYDPKEVTLLFGGISIEGFAEGSFISVEYAVPERTTTTVGADGQVVRTVNNNNSATITVRLMPDSPSIAVIKATRLADQATNAGIVPIALKSGVGDLFAADGAWIQSRTNTEFEGDITPREFVIGTSNLIEL